MMGQYLDLREVKSTFVSGTAEFHRAASASTTEFLVLLSTDDDDHVNHR